MKNDLTIEWGGKEYRIPESEMFELMEAIERHITLPELLTMIGAGKPNFSALARPFHAMLTHADVGDVPSMLELRRMLVKEGFESLSAKASGKGKQPQRAAMQGAAMQAISAMTQILMDGANIQEDDAEEKKSKPRSRKPATRSRSGNGE